MDLNYVSINNADIAYKIFGDGKINLVIESSLNSCSAEWWHIAEQLSSQYTVLVYDRAGYGFSTQSKAIRTPKNIAFELNQLLSQLDTEEKIIIIGHSQGGLYAQQFARLYPEKLKGLILLDPLSANDYDAKKQLTEDEYKKSGFNKTASLKLGSKLTRLPIGFLLKPLIKNAPPFYYYPYFRPEVTKIILKALTTHKQYKTAVSEYQYSHKEDDIQDLKTKEGFPDLPLILITHDSEIAIKENMHFGSHSREFAERVESIWQEIMKGYLSFSDRSKYYQAEKSSHYIHLANFDIVIKALKEMNNI